LPAGGAPEQAFVASRFSRTNQAILKHKSNNGESFPLRIAYIWKRTVSAMSSGLRMRETDSRLHSLAREGAVARSGVTGRRPHVDRGRFDMASSIQKRRHPRNEYLRAVGSLAEKSLPKMKSIFR
jgi:hypothetical protein